MKPLELLLPLLAAAASASRASRAAGGRGTALRPRHESLLSLALDVVASAASDAELGSDLDLLQSESRRLSVESSPRGLEQYCKGSEALDVGKHVDADWMGMGEKYPGTIKDINKDGSVDVSYDDGFDEMNVPMRRVKSTEEPVDTKTDPACQLQEFTKDLKQRVMEVRKKVGKWIEEKTAGLAEAGVDMQKGDEADGGAKNKAAEAEAEEGAKRKAARGSGKGKGAGEDPDKLSGNATKAQSEELERLKEQLDEKDTEIADLEKDLREADDAIEEEGDKDSGPMTMDDLIARYKARIDRRNRRIEELKGKLERRKEKLEEIRDPENDKKDRTTVKDISNVVEDLSKEIDKAREKRSRLEAEGALDPELDHALDILFRMQEQLETQLRELERLQSRVQERKEAARRAAKKAEADAREAAERAGDDPGVVEEKARKAREEANKAAESVDAELLKKARDVSEDLDKVQKSAQELDSGVIPHGAKWWRYRYEHAYVEAILMIVVCLLMLLWERIYHYMRWKVQSLSNAESDNKITHGTMYLGWLEFLAGELMTSLMVFLTCWVMAEAHVFEIFPALLQGSKHLHLPNESYEYRRLSLDVCVVFFFAIIFYYVITLSVVNSCTKKLEDWAQYEEELMEKVGTTPDAHSPDGRSPEGRSPRPPASSEVLPEALQQNLEGKEAAPSTASAVTERRPSIGARSSLPWLGRRSTRGGTQREGAVTRFFPRMTLMGKDATEAKENYQKLKCYFFDKVCEEPALLKAMEHQHMIFSRETFPFWIYIRLAVRRNSDRLFQFGLPVWAALIVTFVVLLFLHRFAHMGCVRVMLAVVLGLMGLLLLMVWWINNICASVMTYSPKGEKGVARLTTTQRLAAHLETMNIHQRFSTEEGVINCLHFLLFFTCYLAARMICQPWMWRLHFWLVLSLTFMLVILGTFFVLMVAPVIPDFCVALSMPPYVDPSDVETMMEAADAAAQMDEDDFEEAIKRPAEMRAAKKSFTTKF